MRVLFKTSPSSIENIEKEFPDHTKIVLPRQGEGIAFEKGKLYRKVEVIMYNYEEDLITIYI